MINLRSHRLSDASALLGTPTVPAHLYNRWVNSSAAETVWLQWSKPSCQWKKRRSIIFCFSHLHLLSRCYQDRTNQAPQAPYGEDRALWFLVGLGCLSLGYRKFVNRRSFRMIFWLSHLQAAIVMAPENGITRWARCGIERLMFRLGTPPSLASLLRFEIKGVALAA